MKSIRPLLLVTTLWSGTVRGAEAIEAPGGDRWIRLIDDAVAMFHEHTTNKSRRSSGRPTK